MSNLKAYKLAIANNGDREDEMLKLKLQIKSQLEEKKLQNEQSISGSNLSQSENIDHSENADDNMARRVLGLDLPEALANIEESAFFTPHELNTNMPHSLESEDLLGDGLENFMDDTDPEKFKSDEQVNRPSGHPTNHRGDEPAQETCKDVAENQVPHCVAIFLILINSIQLIFQI